MDGRLALVFRAVAFLGIWFALWTLAPAAVFRATHGLPWLAQLALSYVVLNAAMLALGLVFLRVFDKRKFRSLGFWFFPGWGRELASGAGMGAGLLVVVVGALTAARALGYHGLAADGIRLLRGVLSTGALMVLAAAFEELSFRGYAFQRLVEAWGPLAPVAVLSGLFGVLHLRNPSATAFSTANTVLAGVLLSVAYLKTRALWLPIGLHWAWNFSMGPIFSLPVSGVRFGPTLLRAEVTGANWLTGGAYGPEGGAALTVICVGAILWLARTRRVAPSAAMAEALK